MVQEEPLQRFGENLRRYRTEAGYSQDRLALDVDVHRTHIGGAERGEINVSLLNIIRLARHLDIPSPIYCMTWSDTSRAVRGMTAAYCH